MPFGGSCDPEGTIGPVGGVAGIRSDAAGATTRGPGRENGWHAGTGHRPGSSPTWVRVGKNGIERRKGRGAAINPKEKPRDPQSGFRRQSLSGKSALVRIRPWGIEVEICDFFAQGLGYLLDRCPRWAELGVFYATDVWLREASLSRQLFLSHASGGSRFSYTRGDKLHPRFCRVRSFLVYWRERHRLDLRATTLEYLQHRVNDRAPFIVVWSDGQLLHQLQKVRLCLNA